MKRGTALKVRKKTQRQQAFSELKTKITVMGRSVDAKRGPSGSLMMKAPPFVRTLEITTTD